MMDQQLHLSKHSKVWSTPGLRNEAAVVIIYIFSMDPVMPGHPTSLSSFQHEILHLGK